MQIVFLKNFENCRSPFKNETLYQESSCSATATISYPASLSKLPNGIPASARHRRIARRLPNRIQIMFWRAATFIQLLAWVDIKMHKAVEAWKQKRSV